MATIAVAPLQFSLSLSLSFAAAAVAASSVYSLTAFRPKCPQSRGGRVCALLCILTRALYYNYKLIVMILRCAQALIQR